MSVKSQIEAYYPSLSKSERKVADYILSNQSQSIYQSLHEVAKFAQVGEATVVRFCNKLGYTGFQDFRLTLAKDMPRRDIDVGDDFTEIITGNLRRSIEDTAALLLKDTAVEAIDILKHAKRIYAFGVGASGIAALDFQSKMLRYGKPITAIIDPHFQTMHAAVMNSSDVVVAFTLTGYTKDIIESLNICKKNGVKIIVVTNHALSPASGLADITLLTAGKESPMDGGSLSGRVSQLYIIDILCTGYAREDANESKLMRSRTSEAVVSKSIDHIRRG